MIDGLKVVYGNGWGMTGWVVVAGDDALYDWSEQGFGELVGPNDDGSFPTQEDAASALQWHLTH